MLRALKDMLIKYIVSTDDDFATKHKLLQIKTIQKERLPPILIKTKKDRLN